MDVGWRRGTRLADRLERYLSASLSYDEVGATDSGELPSGYWLVHQADVVGHGQRSFSALAGALGRWDLQRGIGLSVCASSPEVVPAATVVSALPIGPMSLLVPCRVVYLIARPGVRGFAYGTLAGHPLAGEERFTIELEEKDRVVLRILSFSRPAGLARLSGRLTQAGQAAVNRRYFVAAHRLTGAGMTGGGSP